MAAGVFYYFKKADIRKLFTSMEKRFFGGRLVFDSANERAVKIMLKTWVKEAGITSIKDYFSVSDAKAELLVYQKKPSLILLLLITMKFPKFRSTSIMIFLAYY